MVFAKIGNFILPFVSGFLEDKKEDKFDIDSLTYMKLHKKAQEQKEKQIIPISELKDRPTLPSSKAKKIYNVYLILPEQDTKHTKLISFYKEHSDKILRRWFYLEFNKHIYHESEIKKLALDESKTEYMKGQLKTNSSNFMFLDEEQKLTLGTSTFTENAQYQIEKAENIKLKDRTFETTCMHGRRKYQVKNQMYMLIAIFIICLGIGILSILFFPALSDVIVKTTVQAKEAWITKNSPIPIEANNTILVYQNKTYQIDKT
jgi:hypothetical protein